MNQTNSPLNFIFDFDGTLAETMMQVFEITNKLASKYKYEKIDEKDIEQLRGKGIKNFINHLGIKLYKLPFFIYSVRKMLGSQMKEVMPEYGLNDVVLQMKDDGCGLGIVSANKVAYINSFLKHHSMNYFDFVYSSSLIFGKHTNLKKVIKKHNLDPEITYYVGDESRDIIAAHKAGLKIIAVSWGYNNAKALSLKQPDYLVHTPDEFEVLYDELKANSQAR